MSTYKITRACGHVEAIKITGRQRDQRIAWLEQRSCDTCHRAEWLASRKADGAAAIAAIGDKAAHLPALVGSEKQVAWANQVRAKALVWLATPNAHRQMAGLEASAHTAIWRCTSAKTFCDAARDGEIAVARAVTAWWIATDKVAALGSIASDLAYATIVYAIEEEVDMIPARSVARHFVSAIGASLRWSGSLSASALAAEGWGAMVSELRRVAEGSAIDVSAVPDTFEAARTAVAPTTPASE